MRSSNNRKTKTKVKHIMSLKKYYLSMYRCYLIQLYDRGYISDPTRFDELSIRKLLMELGVNIVNNWGKIDLSSNNVLFFYYKNKNNEDVADFLLILYNVLKYREYSYKVDRIYEEYYLEDSSVVVKTTMKIKCSMIVQQSGLTFDDCIASCIVPFENKVNKISINEDLWKLVMTELGIPKCDWYIDGIFDSSLSHEEEVMFLEHITNGEYKVSGGLYIDHLVKWLYNHKWNDGVRYKADLKGLFDYLFSTYPSEVSNLLCSKIEKLSEEKVIAIDKGSIYYISDRVDFDMPFGQFIIMCDTDCSETILSDINIVGGYTGEVYTENRLIEDGISYVGCPIYVDVSKSKKEIVYDLEQTDIKGDSWFASEENMDLSFEVVDLPNPFEEGSIESQIYQGYINSLCSSDSLITNIKVSTLAELESAKRNVAIKLI